MSKVQILRGFIRQRLSAAAEEIFELFERTIAEYEEQLRRSKEENERPEKLLDAVYNPEVRSRGADIQQLSVNEEEEQQKRPSLDQEDPAKLPHIKEEEEEQRSSQEGEQPPGLEEALTFPPPVKTEEDGEKPQPSQLHEIQTEENREKALQSSESDTDDSCLCGDIMDSESELNPDQNSDRSDSDVKNTSITSTHSSEHPTSFDQKDQLLEHKRNKNSSKLHSCSICKKIFPCKAAVERHMPVHTGERPFQCSSCGTRFTRKSNLTRHQRLHRGKSPFTGSVCDTSFTHKHNFEQHLRVHTGEKPFGCAVCGKRCTTKGNLKKHLVIHTGEKPLSCSICCHRFALPWDLNRHMTVHTGEKPYSCSICGKKFTQNSSLKRHVCPQKREAV